MVVHNQLRTEPRLSVHSYPFSITRYATGENINNPCR